MVDGVDHYLVGEAIMAKMLAGGLVQRETGLVRGLWSVGPLTNSGTDRLGSRGDPFGFCLFK